MSQYFPKLYDPFSEDINVKVDLANYATKTDIKNTSHVDNSSFIDKCGLVKKTDYDTKITEIEDKIPDISNLATKTALTTRENEIPDTSNLATKTALTTVENKIADTSNLVKKANYDAKMTNINNKLDKIDLDMKVLFDLKLKDNRLLRLGDILFNSGDGNQAYLIFQLVRKYFKTDNNSAYILERKSKGLSNESIKRLTEHLILILTILHYKIVYLVQLL